MEDNTGDFLFDACSFVGCNVSLSSINWRISRSKDNAVADIDRGWDSGDCIARLKLRTVDNDDAIVPLTSETAVVSSNNI